MSGSSNTSGANSSNSSAIGAHLIEIDDLEELVEALSDMYDLQESSHRYRLADHDTNNMLLWKNPPQIQPLLMDPFYRVGIVGDGNCMLHTILFATSPTYRTLNYKSQSKITDTFRKVLVARIEEIEAYADIFYAEIGGAEVYADEFAVLREEREEIDIALGPAICRLYGYNFLAVRLDEDLDMEPVRQTFNDGIFDDTLPTILVHYMGGDVNIGKGKQANFLGNGHYEAIIAFPPRAMDIVGGGEASNSNSNISSSEENTKTHRKITRKAKHAAREGVRITLKEHLVQFNFAAADPWLDSILALFLVEEELDPKYVHPLEAAAKKAAEGEDAVAEGGGRRRRRRYTRRRPKQNRHSRQ